MDLYTCIEKYESSDYIFHNKSDIECFIGCGDVPDIADGYVAPLENSTFGSETNVACDTGFTADRSNITCLTSGHWDNVTCIKIGTLYTVCLNYFFDLLFYADFNILWSYLAVVQLLTGFHV